MTNHIIIVAAVIGAIIGIALAGFWLTRQSRKDNIILRMLRSGSITANQAREMREKEPEQTVVYLRTYGITPAKFMESKVHYDAWGTPYIYGDAHHGDWMTNTLYPKGRTGNRWLQWKHKSGPPVEFPNENAPDYGWFPRKTS